MPDGGAAEYCPGMRRRASVPFTQLTLPGMASSCPHCGSRAVEPASDERLEAMGGMPGEPWWCRSCERGFGQLVLRG